MYQVNPRVFAPEKSLLAVADRFLILVNVRSEAKPATIPGSWADQEAKDVLTGKSQKLPSSLQLAPFQYCILSMQ